MKIGVTSQNFRTITGHAGKTRRFLVFQPDGGDGVTEIERWDLPIEQSMHEFRGNEHPLFGLDVLITGSCGQGFIRRLSDHGVRVVATSEQDPVKAAAAVSAGRELPAAAPHEH